MRDVEVKKRPVRSRESKYMLVLRALQKNGKMTNQELNKICFRYGARIADIRRDGYIIVTNQIKRGYFEYIYKGHREDRDK